MLNATPVLRAYGSLRRRRLARQQAVSAQRDTLQALVARAAGTRFGRDHDFGSVATVRDFQRRVPLRHYEDFWEEYWRTSFPSITDVTWPGLIPYFAQTSGTSSGTTKYIPCSHDMVRSNRRAALELMAHHLASRPSSRVLGGRSFMLGGSTDLKRLTPRVEAGDLSGIAVKTMPAWARPWYFPPLELALIADWEEKVERLAKLSLQQDIRAISGTPSWLLLFFDQLASILGKADARLVDFYPNLELLVYGGVNFAPYRSRFEALLDGSHAELREVYPASEGFIAIADRGPGEGLRLILDNGLFFEFVPVSELDSAQPVRHWLEDVELDVDYAIVLSTCAGLWSYVLGDTVKLVERDPARLLVTGRTSYMLSAFGEHLIDAEIERSVAAAAADIGRMVMDYTVGALFPERVGDRGGHLFLVEFSDGVPASDEVGRFALRLDAALADENEDYRAHRAEDFGLNAPQILALPPGSFARWMKSQGKLGGQNKVPRIISDAEKFSALRAFFAGP